MSASGDGGGGSDGDANAAAGHGGHGGDGGGGGHGGHGEGHGGHEEEHGGGDTLRQASIVSVLVIVLMMLHRYGGPAAGVSYDPTAMLALGFVVLASYTIGHLVDVIKLPHLTGYILAGLVFGPSIAHLLNGWDAWGLVPPIHLLPPFDQGVLRTDVLAQLKPLETLAVALIALTAGGELKLEALKRGVRTLFFMLFTPLTIVLLAVTGFFWLVSGTVPAIALPGIDIPADAVIPVALTFATVAFATSPAVTIALVIQLRPKGPMSQNVLSAVVLTDVVVVVLFGIFSSWALTTLGVAGDGSLAKKLSIEIAGSLGVGAALGAVSALYVRYVGRELLLFVLGVVYVGSFVSGQLHLDVVLVFLAAGFVVSNFSPVGHRMIEAIEQLSLPTYVVFFTLAGAKLHLDEVAQLLPFALALVGLRVLSMFLGVRLGARLGGADAMTQRYGWMGFVSQAGVAIALAALFQERMGPEYETLTSLLIAGVALNEMIGPVLFKTGLTLAGELETAAPKVTAAEPEARVLAAENEEARAFHPWPQQDTKVDWGDRKRTGSLPLDRALRELEHDLRAIVREVGDGPMIAFREDAERYLRELRIEFLRHHRRILVRARSVAEAAREGVAETHTDACKQLALALRTEQAELAERWRSIVLARAASLTKEGGWTPAAIVQGLDDAVAAVPELVEVPWAPTLFETKEGDTPLRRARRTALRLRRGAASVFSKGLADRPVELRSLARYHLEYVTPTRLEAVAAVLVSAEQHLAGRTRHLFDAMVAASDAIADEMTRGAFGNPDESLDAVTRIERVREELEEDLLLAFDEVTRIARDGTARTARVLAHALRDVREEALLYGTLELPSRDRRASRAFQARMKALDQLGETLVKLRRSTAGEYSLLAMELELLGLESRVKDLLASHATRLEGEMRRRALAQAERVRSSLEETGSRVDEAVETEGRADDMAAAIREATAASGKVAGEAARIVRELRDELLDERKVAPLLDALGEATAQLTTRYEVVAGRLQRGEYKLPPPLERVDVPFREVVAEHVEGQVTPLLFRATREMAERLQPLVSGLREVERLVAFNVELATSELDVIPDETVPEDTRRLLREIVGGQIERSLGQLEGFQLDAARWPEVLAESVHEAVLGALDELRGQLVDGKITRAKLEELRRIANRRRLARRAGQIPRLLREGRTQLKRAFVALVGEARLERLRTKLGLPSPADRHEAEAGTFAAPPIVTDLPLVYRRLFSADTMEAGDVLTGREAAILRAREVLEAKRAKGRLRSVALVGLDGVGKASVSNAVVRGARWRSIKRINLEGPVDVAGVDALLRECVDAQLVVLDGLCWLASAEPGGFAPLRRFIDGVVADGGKRAWLLHAESLFWRWGSAIAPLREAFPEVVELEPLSLDELTTAVMERHRLSGYGHAFDRIEGTSALEGVLARGASRIRRPFEHYFAELHTVTGGLVRDALRLWLASIRGIEGTDIVRIGPVPPAPYLALSRLTDEELLSLFLVARQGWMRAEAFAWLLCVEPTAARARLARLTHLGLLEKTNDSYRVSLHLRGALSLVVQDRGWM